MADAARALVGVPKWGGAGQADGPPTDKLAGCSPAAYGVIAEAIQAAGRPLPQALDQQQVGTHAGHQQARAHAAQVALRQTAPASIEAVTAAM